MTSCGSHKKISELKTGKISTVELINKLNREQYIPEIFESAISVDYNSYTQNIKAKGKIKILKDSIIWISFNVLGVPLSKVMLTPSKVQYYNKLNRTYYKGNYSMVKNITNVDLKFKNIQNLLFANPVFPLKKDEYILRTEKEIYRLNAKNKEIMSRIYVNSFYKIISELLILPLIKQKLEINYNDFIEVQNKSIPGTIELKTDSKEDKINIKIRYKKPVFNQKTHYPFNIPNGYRQIDID